MKQTTNFHLNKPDITDYYNIQDSNNNMDIIDDKIKEAQDKADLAFQSASNGKAAIKTAITGVDPTVTIPTDATFNQLATAISQIKTGVDTEDATVTAAQILANMTAYVKGVKITGTAADNGPIAAETVNLTAQNQEYTIASGFHSGLRKIKVVITNLAAGVIKAGVTVGGILGTFTADATATAAQMLSGVTAYVNGNKITGNIPIRNTSDNYFPTEIYGVSTRIYVKPENAYYAPAGSASNPGGIGGWLKVDDTNFVAANILSGKSIFGLAGSLIAGKRSASGTATTSASYIYFTCGNGESKPFYYFTVNGLTFKPSLIYVYWLQPSSYAYGEYALYYPVSPSYYSNLWVVTSLNMGYGSVGSYGVKADVSPAYVTGSGFCAPFINNDRAVNWIAIE